jgi:hypothetical protein
MWRTSLRPQIEPLGITVESFYSSGNAVTWFSQCQAGSKPQSPKFSNSMVSVPSRKIQPLCQKGRDPEISLPVPRENCFDQLFSPYSTDDIETCD